MIREPPHSRICAECGVPVRPGDGGIRVWGLLFCSDICADYQDLAFADPPEEDEWWAEDEELTT